MKPAKDDAFRIALGFQLLHKVFRKRFSSEEEYREARDAFLVENVTDDIALEVLAAMVLQQTRSFLIAHLWNERKKRRSCRSQDESLAVRLAMQRNQRKWFLDVLYTEGIYNLAYRAGCRTTTDRAISTNAASDVPWIVTTANWICVLLTWLECARALWDGDFGDPYALASHLQAQQLHASQMIEHHRERGNEKLARDMEEEQKKDGALGLLFPPDMLGTRGRAKASRDGAMRGWLIRRIDRLLPPVIDERYAIIAALLESIGVTGLTPQLVRATLKHASRA